MHKFIVVLLAFAVTPAFAMGKKPPTPGQFDLNTLAGTYQLSQCSKNDQPIEADHKGLELEVDGTQVKVKYLDCTDPYNQDWSTLVKQINQPKSQREEWGDGHKDVYTYESYTTQDGVYWEVGREAWAGGFLKDAFIYNKKQISLIEGKLTLDTDLDRKFPIGAHEVKEHSVCTYLKN